MRPAAGQQSSYLPVYFSQHLYNLLYLFQLSSSRFSLVAIRHSTFDIRGELKNFKFSYHIIGFISFMLRHTSSMFGCQHIQNATHDYIN